MIAKTLGTVIRLVTLLHTSCWIGSDKNWNIEIQETFCIIHNLFKLGLNRIDEINKKSILNTVCHSRYCEPGNIGACFIFAV